MDPVRIMDNTTDPLELALLRAGREDCMSDASRRGILSALGVMMPVVGAGLTSLPSAVHGDGSVSNGSVSNPATTEPALDVSGADTFGSQSGVIQTNPATAGAAKGAGSIGGLVGSGSGLIGGKGIALAAGAIIAGALALWSTSTPSPTDAVSVTGAPIAAADVHPETAASLGARPELKPGDGRGKSPAPGAQALEPRNVDSENDDSRNAARAASGAAESGLPETAETIRDEAESHALGQSTARAQSAARGDEPSPAGGSGPAHSPARIDGRTATDKTNEDVGRPARPRRAGGQSSPEPVARNARQRTAIGAGQVRSPNDPVPSDGDPSTLSLELKQIDSARRALVSNSPRVALQRLKDYHERFPNGRLRTEATILRIEALMAAGDRAGAARLGKSVLDRAPNSPYARRVRSLLGDE